MAGRRRAWLVALFLSAITLGSGIVNLVSVMGGPSHPKILADIFPLEFIRLSRTLTILIGFALVVSSINVYKRKRRAWAIVLGLSLFSTVVHLTKGLDYAEAALSFALFIMLLLARKIFSVKSSPPDLAGGVLRLLVAAAVALGYGIAGFWLLDVHHFGINFHIGDAIVTTLRFLSLSADPHLVPRTHYAHWFLDSLYIMTSAAIVYSGFALFRPVIYRFSVVPRERALARGIVEQHGRTTLDFFKLWPDKSYFFSPSHRCFIAYCVAGNVALALGDPVGPEEEIELTLREFVEMCRENAWIAGFYQTLADFLPAYRRVKLNKLKIGDDAMVDLRNFSLAGKSMREFRSKIRQLESTGVHTVEYSPPLSAEVIGQLKTVSDDWLQIPGRRERTFALGQFDPEYVRSTPVIAAASSNGELLAFLNVIVMGKSEITGDLMRRRANAPNGIMDYLFVKLFLSAKRQGYERFNLGMAPMAGFKDREDASVEERAIHGFFQQLNFLFSYRGLRQFKAKFATSWEPRYVIYRNVLELPRLAFAMRRVSEIKDPLVIPTLGDES
jgi:phosphatidylglycerol lysyltransferase